MSFNISYIIEAIDKFSAVGRAVQKSMAGITAKANKLSATLERTHRGLTRLGREASLRLTAPIVALGVASVKASADVERWTTQWQVYTHNAGKARQMTQSLMQWAKRTPFRIPDIQRAGIVLAGLMDPLDKIPGDLKELANVAAMTGVPLSVLATNFGKVISAQKLMGIELMELRRIGVAVIPAFNKLNKEMGKPPAQLRDLVAQGRITASDFRRIIEAMAGDTGVYAHGTEKLAQTLIGMYTTVRDNIFLTRQAIGDQIVGITDLHARVKQLNATMTRFTETLKPWIAAHKAFAAIAVEVGIILALLGPALIVLGQIAWAVWGISKALGVILGLFRLISTVALFFFLSGPGLLITALAVIIGSIVLILHHFYRWKQIIHGIKIGLHDIWKVLKLVAIPFKPIIWVFKEIWKLIKHIGGYLWKNFLSPIDESGKGIERISRGLSRLLIPKDVLHAFRTPMFAQGAAFAPQGSVMQSIQSSLAISLHDPGRNIKAVTGTSTGNMTFDTGTNMMMSRI